MKYIDEFRNKDLVKRLIHLIGESVRGDYSFMEVCGGHTAAIRRFGLTSLLPDCIKLISGPGCPVCVTGIDFIDKAIEYSRMDRVIITTFGDLIRLPGTDSSLQKEMAEGADVRIVLSPLEALDIAVRNRDKMIIFLAIGFETTAPGSAIAIEQAENMGIKNFFLLNAHKTMPPAMEAILEEGVRFDGFICPGHVSSITGSSVFEFIPERYKLGCVITGFEPVDLLQSILMLINQINSKYPKVEIQYRRAVTIDGNQTAKNHLLNVFRPDDSLWRGFGIIPKSGLCIRKSYEHFDIETMLPLKITSRQDNELCICGKILRGLNTPVDCPLFAAVCFPENPLGACMVSDEGTCNTWYKFNSVI